MNFTVRNDTDKTRTVLETQCAVKNLLEFFSCCMNRGFRGEEDAGKMALLSRSANKFTGATFPKCM